MTGEPSFWRKIFVSFVTLPILLSMMSPSTLPGPTLGSWFGSPTSTRCFFLHALNRIAAISVSIIDASSQMTIFALSNAFVASFGCLVDCFASSSEKKSSSDAPLTTIDSARCIV